MKSLFIVLFLSLILFGCGGGQKQSAMLPSTISNPGSGPAPTPTPTPTPPSSPGATTQCAAGEYDMLDWATMDPDLAAGYHLEGNANPLYTVVQKDRFYWLKSASGYPWDIQLLDNNYIYLWVTEQNWNDPYTYKASHNRTNMPLTTRCAKGGQSQPGTTVKSADTTFDIVNGCTNKVTQNLGTMINDVWGPYTMSFGGDLPANMPTLIVSYRYSCDANYANCLNREQYYLSQRYGLVRWDHSMLTNGQYVQDNYTVYNRVVAGGPPTPMFPCGG